MLVKTILGAPLALFFFVIVLNPPQAQPISLGIGPLSIDHNDLKILWTFYSDVFQKAFINKNHTITAFAKETTMEDISKGISEVGARLEKIGSKILAELNIMTQTILTKLNDDKLSEKMEEFFDAASNVEYILRKVYKYEKETQNATFEKLIISITNPDETGIIDELTRIYSHVFGALMGYKPSNLVDTFRESTKNTSENCGSRSPYEALYEIYETAIITEAKGMYILSVAYKYLEKFEERPENYYNLTLYTEYKEFLDRTNSYTILFKHALKEASRGLRGCNPHRHERDVTFFEFERLIGNVLLRESVFEGKSCSTYDNPKENFTYPSQALYCGHQQNCALGANACYGTLSECTSYGESLNVCIADLLGMSRRRYAWVYDRSHANGQKSCTAYEHSSWAYLKKASLCLCTCVEDTYVGRALQFVSLRPVTTNIDENMVITGIKFTKTNNIIQLKIQEGNLTADGTIHPDTVQWHEPEQLSYNMQLSDFKKDFVFLKRNPEDDLYEELKNNEDIAILTQSERTFNLDELHAPKGHVITGVRFSRGVKQVSPNTNPIQIEIRATPFNYEKGILQTYKDSQWISASSMIERAHKHKGPVMSDVLAAYKRSRDHLSYGDYRTNPIHTARTVQDFNPNTFIQLDKTSFSGDSGQTVIPLLDAVAVYTEPPVPISGLSFFHKAIQNENEKSPGFLSFRLFTIDRSHHLNPTGAPLRFPQIIDGAKDSSVD